MTIDNGPLTIVNKDCNPPWTHAINCRCAEKEKEDAADYEEMLMDKWYGPEQ